MAKVGTIVNCTAFGTCVIFKIMLCKRSGLLCCKNFAANRALNAICKTCCLTDCLLTLNSFFCMCCKRNYFFCCFLAVITSCAVCTADYACFWTGGILMSYNAFCVVRSKVTICCAANFTLCLFCAGCWAACMIFICFNCCFAAIGTNNCSCAVAVVLGIFVCANGYSYKAVTCENCIIGKSYFTEKLISANGICKSCTWTEPSSLLAY